MNKPLAFAGRRLDLRVEQHSVDDLKPYRRNARVHSTKQIAQIAASIRRFGFVVPVLADDDGTVLAGHGRMPTIPFYDVRSLARLRSYSARIAFPRSSRRLAPAISPRPWPRTRAI